MKALKVPTTEDFERLPWSIRALMGCEAALIAQVVNFWFLPLRAVPMALAFPAVILCAWFLEMWGAAVCAFTSIFVVDFYLSAAGRFSAGRTAHGLDDAAAGAIAYAVANSGVAAATEAL